MLKLSNHLFSLDGNDLVINCTFSERYDCIFQYVRGMAEEDASQLDSGNPYSRYVFRQYVDGEWDITVPKNSEDSFLVRTPLFGLTRYDLLCDGLEFLGRKEWYIFLDILWAHIVTEVRNIINFLTKDVGYTLENMLNISSMADLVQIYLEEEWLYGK